jgi:hypothetical protein
MRAKNVTISFLAMLIAQDALSAENAYGNVITMVMSLPCMSPGSLKCVDTANFTTNILEFVNQILVFSNGNYCRRSKYEYVENQE